MNKFTARRAKKREEAKTVLGGSDLLSSGAATLPLMRAPEEPQTEAAVVPAASSQEEMNQENTAETASAAAENLSDVGQDVPDSPPSSGVLLKTARETAGLSIDDVARVLKLAPRQIQALEQENFAALPPRTFVRGFIRNYARLLNIDAGTVLATLPPEIPPTISPAASSLKASLRAMPVLPSHGGKTIRPQTWKWWSAILFLAVVAAAFFFWPQLIALLPERAVAPTASGTVANEEFKPSRQESESATIFAPVFMPLSEAPVDPAALPDASSSGALTGVAAEPATESAEAELVLRFNGNSWTEVRDGHGKTLYSALAKNGDEKILLGTPPFSLVIGNSNAASVTLRGEKIDLPGRQGVARLTLE
ncbi:MAG: DUF4115 domain-containing protein [Burkholderiales bacterium]|nr:DUF4115 domain-containing protein [Burkholderiales bacterium]